MKQTNFFFLDPDIGTWVAHSKESLLQSLKAYVEEMNDGEEMDFEVRRKDMTTEEINNLPEI